MAICFESHLLRTPPPGPRDSWFPRSRDAALRAAPFAPRCRRWTLGAARSRGAGAQHSERVGADSAPRGRLGPAPRVRLVEPRPEALCEGSDNSRLSQRERGNLAGLTRQPEGQFRSCLRSIDRPQRPVRRTDHRHLGPMSCPRAKSRTLRNFHLTRLSPGDGLPHPLPLARQVRHHPQKPLDKHQLRSVVHLVLLDRQQQFKSALG